MSDAPGRVGVSGTTRSALAVRVFRAGAAYRACGSPHRNSVSRRDRCLGAANVDGANALESFVQPGISGCKHERAGYVQAARVVRPCAVERDYICKCKRDDGVKDVDDVVLLNRLAVLDKTPNETQLDPAERVLRFR